MPLVRRLPRRIRAALLVVHVVASAGWLGLDGALVALQVTVLQSGDPAVRAGVVVAMTVIACWVLIPVVCASLCSGLVLALGTSWGLARHWWLVAKFVIAVMLTATGAVLTLPRLPEVLAGEGEPVQAVTLAARSVALALLLIATGLSVVKPWGKTQMAGSRGTPSTPIAQSTGIDRSAASLWPGCLDALVDMDQQARRQAQLHALRNLRALPGAPGGRVLIRGSRTWIDTDTIADAASVVRPQRQPADRNRRPPRRSRSFPRARS
ncbi:MAG: hypothetical protein WCC38_02625 [Pseudonocardiaceae bacterium]